MARNPYKCPVPNRVFGEDTDIFEDCLRCEIREKCAAKRQRRVTKEAETLAYPRYFTVPLGLFTDKNLSDHDRLIIALVAFRQRGRDGHSYDTNAALVRLLGLSKQRVSEIISRLIG